MERGIVVNYKISASIMCANLLNLAEDIQELNKAEVDYLHWDIMDGIFVPNYSLNPDIMKRVREITNIKYDTHLMIIQPELHLDKFVEAGTDIMVVHAESTIHLHRLIQKIKEKDVKVGVALNPATPLINIKHILKYLDMVLIMTVNPGFAGQQMIPETLDKIEELREFIEKSNLDVDIEVDGNVSFKNTVEMKKRGANVFVVGSSSIFKAELTISSGVRKMREIFDDIITDF
jgi:ribulose-phosphate 3-epimerase